MDRDTFWDQINPLQERLFKFGFSILSNKDDAQDAVHDVIEILWHKRQRLKSDKNINAFALKVMKNHCIDKLRKRRRFIEVDIDEEPSHVDNDYEKLDMLKLIKSRINQLPIQQRMIIELKDLQGYNYEEISKVMEIPVTTLRVNLSRARKYVLKSIKNER